MVILSILVMVNEFGNMMLSWRVSYLNETNKLKTGTEERQSEGMAKGGQC